ncbi:MAG: TlpA family protein disulfide reductase [Bernardetiaceae bacterium]
MRLFVLLGIFIMLGVNSLAQSPAASVEKINLKQLQDLIETPDDQTRIINFWATWCRPCVAEMPHFEAIHNRYTSEGVSVIFVSLDFADNLEKRVIPFVERKGIQAKVVLLDESDAAQWMPAIQPDWQGNIPATLVVNNKKGIRSFYAQELSESDLENILQPIIHP